MVSTMPNALSPMPAFDFINSNVMTHGESQHWLWVEKRESELYSGGDKEDEGNGMKAQEDARLAEFRDCGGLIWWTVCEFCFVFWSDESCFRSAFDDLVFWQSTIAY